MAVFHPQKEVCPRVLTPGQTAQLILRFDAAGGLEESADLVLALDRSGSMGGLPLAGMKRGACRFTDLLLEGSRGKLRMAVLSYADCTRRETELTACPKELHCAISGLEAGGNTNHQLAFEAAGRILKCSRANRKLLVLFTDGRSNLGNPDPAAEALRKAGVEIFCIGLNVERCLLSRWASCPCDRHVEIARDECCLEEAFCAAAGKITGSETREIRIQERLNPGFRIRKPGTPSRGKVRQLDCRTLLWTIDAVGTCGEETLCLTAEICYEGCGQGLMEVNESITYEDRQGGTLCFPNPQVEICRREPEPGDFCPEPVCIRGESCRDRICGIPVDTCLSGLGRIVEVQATVRDVCPNKALAVAVILTETDPEGKEHNRGMKVFEVPPREGTDCADVTLNCIQFVVPESVRTWDCCKNLCGQRSFRARVLANYLDTDFSCCEAGTCL